MWRSSDIRRSCVPSGRFIWKSCYYLEILLVHELLINCSYCFFVPASPHYLIPNRKHISMWKWVCRIFVVYLNFNVPDSTQMTFNTKRFMYRTYFVKLKFRGYWELKELNSIHGHFRSLGSKDRFFFFPVFLLN